MKKIYLLFLLLPLLTLSAQEGPHPYLYEVAEADSINKTFDRLPQQPADHDIIEDQSKTAILSPSLAGRETLKIRLKNGLQAYLVSDPQATKSAAALSVHVGSWSDPDETPGLAHFLEHMLFLGTKKYPKEAEYHRFINEHDGTSNAYTSSDHTSYAFAIDHAAFEEALDRFSWFFKAPLFNPSGTERELQAVHQEYGKNIENDSMREFFVLKELADPKHPYHRFNIGTKETLKNVDRQALKQWYENHYSANLMHLSVYSSLPIEQIKKIVITNFCDIENRDRAPLAVEAPLLREDLKGHFVYITPVKKTRSLTLTWELPKRFTDQLSSKPHHLISFVLGHEGKESLLAQLKREKLAESLSSGGYRLGSNSMLFSIDIALTELGLDQVETIVSRCFQAVHNFEKRGFPKYLFDEIKTMETLDYQYQGRPQPFEQVMSDARQLLVEPLESYPEKTEITQQLDPRLVQDFLQMLTPENCLFVISAKPEETGIVTAQKEQWLGAEYTVKAIADTKLAAWNNIDHHPDIDIPPPNPLIPKNLELITTQKIPAGPEDYPHPELLIDTPSGKCYFATDKHYLVPEFCWHLEIKTPNIQRDDARSLVLADLYLRCISEELNNFSYIANMAGLGYNIGRTDEGISLVLSGYSEHADELIEEILDHLRSVNPTAQKFAIYKESLKRKYQNFTKEPPLKHGYETLKSIINEKYVLKTEKVHAIENINLDHLRNYIASLYEKTYIEGIFYGNTSKEKADHTLQKIEQTLKSEPYPPEEHQPRKVIILPNNSGPYFVEKTAQSLGNATILGIQYDSYSFLSRAAHQILCKAMEEPFFSTLRTKQQTGYIVYSYGQPIEKQLFQFFFVQSNSHNTRDLLARFELFIEAYLQELGKSQLTTEQFETIKQSLISSLKKPPKSITEMATQLQWLAFEENGDFDFVKKRVQGLKQLSYKEFIQQTQRFLGRSNSRRLAILIEGTRSDENTLNYNLVEDTEKFKKNVRFQHSPHFSLSL